MTYRADWFAEAGIDTPQTYNDLLKAARVIKQERPGVTPFGIVGARTSSPAAKFLTLFYRMGGESVNGIPQFDSEAGRFLLGYYQTLMREELAHPDTLAWTSGESRGSMIEGIEGMTMISQNIYPTLNGTLEYGSEWALLPGLYREGAQSEMVMTFRAVTALVAGNTLYPDEAALLVRYLAGPDYGLDLSVRYQPSLNASVATNPEYLAVAPWAPDLESYVAAAKPLPANVVSSALYDIVHDMKQEAISNPNADVADIAKRAQAQMTAIAED
jgi:ABC-type glycerol-3-phosphate transport system substrate-binding protein